MFHNAGRKAAESKSCAGSFYMSRQAPWIEIGWRCNGAPLSNELWLRMSSVRPNRKWDRCLTNTWLVCVLQVLLCHASVGHPFQDLRSDCGHGQYHHLRPLLLVWSQLRLTSQGIALTARLSALRLRVCMLLRSSQPTAPSAPSVSSTQDKLGAPCTGPPAVNSGRLIP